MLPLPRPQSGGQLATLKRFLNIHDASDWRLVVHWHLAALRPRGPYPVLVVYGGHGSAKTTLVRVLRSLVDPNTAPLRLPPRDVQNVAIAASNSWVVAYDNLSHLPDWLSDALCCISTGLGFATRSLFTDGEEVLFQAVRPIVVNGIEEVQHVPISWTARLSYTYPQWNRRLCKTSRPCGKMWSANARRSWGPCS
jgi:hypothetical protein